MRISDEDWLVFRTAVAGQSIARALGALVEREVAAYRLRVAQRDKATAHELAAAVDAARVLRSELAAVTARLEALTLRPSNAPTDWPEG